MRNLRARDGKCLAQGHMACSWQSWNCNGVSQFEAQFFSSVYYLGLHFTANGRDQLVAYTSGYLLLMMALEIGVTFSFSKKSGGGKSKISVAAGRC